jgi:hypothetical protein
MWMGRKFAGEEVKPDITQFVFTLVVAVMRVFEYFRGMLDERLLYFLIGCCVWCQWIAWLPQVIGYVVSCHAPHPAPLLLL